MKTTTRRQLAVQRNFPRQLSIEYENYNNLVVYIYIFVFYFHSVFYLFISPSFRAQWSATSGPQYARPSSWRSGRLFRFWRRVKVGPAAHRHAITLLVCLEMTPIGASGDLTQLRGGCVCRDLGLLHLRSTQALPLNAPLLFSQFNQRIYYLFCVFRKSILALTLYMETFVIGSM